MTPAARLEKSNIKRPPLASLRALKHIQLFGVRPTDKSLMPLERCPALMSGRFSKFPKAEVRRFYEATGVYDDWIPEMPRAAAG